MQRLWFPPGSASYKKADDIVVQDALDSIPEEEIQQFEAMAKAPVQYSNAAAVVPPVCCTTSSGWSSWESNEV